MHYRAEYRAACRTSLQAVPGFADVKMLSAWTEGINAEELPVMAVVTPSERSSPDTHTSFEKGTLLQVVLKRLGGDDIEDVLDDDSVLVEAAIATAMPRPLQCLLEETTTVVNGEGARRIGTLTMSFRVTSWREAAT